MCTCVCTSMFLERKARGSVLESVYKNPPVALNLESVIPEVNRNRWSKRVVQHNVGDA